MILLKRCRILFCSFFYVLCKNLNYERRKISYYRL